MFPQHFFSEDYIMKTVFQDLKCQGDALTGVKGPRRLNLSHSLLLTTISEL